MAFKSYFVIVLRLISKFFLFLILISSLAKAASSQSYYLGGLNLETNQSITLGSGNSAATMTMQSDGNLVVYKNSAAVWASGTNSSGCLSGCNVTFQTDGNLVLYGNGKPTWSTATRGQSAATLVFQNVAPYLQILSLTGASLWQSSPALTYTVGGLNLTQNQSVTVGTGAESARLVMQSDGNLVIYKNSAAVWASGNGGANCPKGCNVNFQTDGNLVLYDGKPVWATATHGQSAATLVFQNIPPYLQIANSIGAPIWQSSGSLPPIGPAQRNSVPPGPWAGDLNILSYGAVPDGVTDNAKLINKALSDAAAAKVGVFIPPGQFAYNSMLNNNGVRINGVGNASHLIALNPGLEPIVVTGDGAIVANIMMTIAPQPSRLTAPWNEPIWIKGGTGPTCYTATGAPGCTVSTGCAGSTATNFQIDHVYINYSASGGIGDMGGCNGKVTNNTVLNTWADSISNTSGVSSVLIDSNYVENSGDDGISVFDYFTETMNQDITITNNVVINNTWGRNLTVVGGSNITYFNNYANGNLKNLACLYFASEDAANHTTRGAKNVTASFNTLMNCGGSNSGYAAFTVAAYSGAPDTNNNIVLQNSIIAPGGEPGIGIYGPKSSGIQLIDYLEVGQSIDGLGSPGQITSNIPWTTGPVGYTPAPAGVSGAIPVVPAL